jgi:hypothetical protein
MEGLRMAPPVLPRGRRILGKVQAELLPRGLPVLRGPRGAPRPSGFDPSDLGHVVHRAPIIEIWMGAHFQTRASPTETPFRISTRPKSDECVAKSGKERDRDEGWRYPGEDGG